MSILDYQLDNRSLSHAYIFESPNESYNLDFAIDFANKVFRKNDINVEASLNPDLFILDREGDVIDIESIREIIKDISLRPSNGIIKIYIIHNAQDMRLEGANALLKTIEELKEYNLVIFTTTNSQLILPTIRSRCQYVRLSATRDTSAIDMDKLSSILAKVYRGDIGVFYKEKKFFDQYKDDRDTLIEAILTIFDYIISLKYGLYKEITDDLAYNLTKMTSMSVDQIEDMANLLNKIRVGFRNNINYDLAIEQIVFAIYRGGMKF